MLTTCYPVFSCCCVASNSVLVACGAITLVCMQKRTAQMHVVPSSASKHKDTASSLRQIKDIEVKQNLTL